MSDSQFMFIAQLKFSDCQIRTIGFDEGGNMLISFFDKGGNLHKQIHHARGTVSTVES